jgi:hypothetical protein
MRSELEKLYKEITDKIVFLQIGLKDVKYRGDVTGEITSLEAVRVRIKEILEMI